MSIIPPVGQQSTEAVSGCVGLSPLCLCLSALAVRCLILCRKWMTVRSVSVLQRRDRSPPSLTAGSMYCTYLCCIHSLPTPHPHSHTRHTPPPTPHTALSASLPCCSPSLCDARSSLHWPAQPAWRCVCERVLSHVGGSMFPQHFSCGGSALSLSTPL
jgi:hypothetical protein